MTGVYLMIVGGFLLIGFLGYIIGETEARHYYETIVLPEMRRTIKSLCPPGVTVPDVGRGQVIVTVEEIEPGSPEDLYNRADPGCELCEGTGRIGSRTTPCPCTNVGTR